MPPNVTIPIYGQQTDTPFEATPKLVAPEIQPAGVGGALSKMGDTLMNIWNIQQHNENQIQLSEQLTKFAYANIDIQNKTADQPGAQQGDYYKAESQKAVNDILADPKNQPIAQELQIGLQHAIATNAEQVSIHGMSVAVKDQAARVNAHGTQSAALAAAGYTPITNKDGTTSFVDTPDAMDAEMAHVKLIDQVYPPDSRPGENQAMKLAYLHQKMIQRGAAIARNNPTLTDEYVAQNADKLTSDEATALHIKATEAIRAPMTAIDAQQAAIRANLYDKFTKQATAGSLDTADLYQQRQKRNITEDDYEHFAGIPFLGPGNPSVKADYLDRIDKAGSPEELDALNMSMQFDQNVGRDKVGLGTAIQIRKKYFETKEGQQRRSDLDMIRRNYEVGGIDGKIYNELAPASLDTLRMNATDAYNAATYGIHDPGKAHEAAVQALKANSPDWTLIRSKSGAKPSSVTPPGISDDELLKHARAKGIIR